MATIQFKRFSDAALLRRFNFDLLYQFLLPYRDYLCEKHHFRWTDNLLMFPYQDLVAILSEPDDNMPELLHNSLFFIDELSTSKGTELILQRFQEDGISIPKKIAREDLALYTWMLDQKILQAVHPQLAALRPKRFERSYCHQSAWPDLSRERIMALEDDLNDWFDSLNKGRGVQVMYYVQDGTISFHLRHGELLKRDTALKNNGMTRRIVYRPERYDFLDYTPNERVLKIHSETKRENAVYRNRIGKHCFGDENYFFIGDGRKQYTLDPIREQGRDAIVCRDVSGLEWVRLKELQTLIPDQNNYCEIFKSEHCLFDEWDRIGPRYRDTSEFTRASFLIQVAGLARPRSLTICLPDVTIYDRGRKIDTLFSLWMKNRKFAL